MPAAGLLVLLFAVAVYQRTLLKGKNAVWGIRFHKHNMVAVADQNDNVMDMGHISYRYVSQMLSTFIVEGKRRRYYVMLMPDSLPTEEYRHLRIQLNTGSGSIPKNDRPPAAGAK